MRTVERNGGHQETTSYNGGEASEQANCDEQTGKGLHGWFQAENEAEDRLRAFMAYAITLGADDATWNRSLFVRMPDGLRDNGQRQTVYYFAPEFAKGGKR